MEVLDHVTAVSTDGRTVLFTLSVRNREVECTVTRDALEQHFWLTPDADAARTIRAFEDGRDRIVALARRKLLARSTEPVRLTVKDFAPR
ncbi:Protein of unknown function [Burkholderia sp. GAS332]|nr:Protein of unknown function [Burkholderia sp. GAS332]